MCPAAHMHHLARKVNASNARMLTLTGTRGCMSKSRKRRSPISKVGIVGLVSLTALGPVPTQCMQAAKIKDPRGINAYTDNLVMKIQVKFLR